MERVVLEWTASSAESMTKLPPEIVRPLSALSPFMLVPLSGAADGSISCPRPGLAPPRKPPQKSEASLSPFSLPPPATMLNAPSEICKYAPALIPSPSAAMSSAPPEM